MTESSFSIEVKLCSSALARVLKILSRSRISFVASNQLDTGTVPFYINESLANACICCFNGVA